MLTLLIVLIVLYGVARFFFASYTGRPKLSNAVALCIAGAFALGAALYAFVVGAHNEVASAPASAPAVVAQSAPAAAAPPLQLRPVAAGKLQSLTQIRGVAALGHIDVLVSGGMKGDTFPRNGTITASGWAADPRTKAPGSGLMLIIDGRTRVDATRWYGANRPDVGVAFNAPSMSGAGFASAPFVAAGLTTGAHRLGLGVITPDGAHFYALGSELTFEVQ